MADKLGISRPTYVLIESGKKIPDIAEIKIIAMTLNVTPTDLLGDTMQTQNDDTRLIKYKQMILACLLYGGDKSDGKITKTKLAKLVYLTDFAWFYNNLKPMSGLSYRRIPQGPVPDLYFRAIDELFGDGAINIEQKGQAFVISLVEKPSSSYLANNESGLIKKIANKWQGSTTEEIVNFTHNQLPWKICRPGEIVPYELITQEDNSNVF
jgi:uncharacterized phage-associated protein